MTDILIQGMEMPNVGEKIEFTQNIAGRIYAKFNPSKGYMCEVIKLPEHGDLVERERVINLINSILEQTYDAEAIHRLMWLRDCVKRMANFALLPRQEETK